MYVSSLREEEEKEESIVKSDVFRIMSKMFKPKEKYYTSYTMQHIHTKNTQTHSTYTERNPFSCKKIYSSIEKQLTYLVQMFCTL